MRALFIVAGLLLAPLCRADDDYPILVYPVPEALTALRILGSPDEPSWSLAPLVGGFTFYDRQERPEAQTFLRVLWDRDNLYFSIRCDEPLMPKVSPAARPRDAHEIFGDEAIEVFLDPTHDHSHYYQLGVNAGGSLYDSEGTNPSWNSDAQVAVQLEGDAWLVELAIPWKSLAGAQPKPGAVLGFNVCRDRYLGGVREWSNWSQTRANFHDPDRFAHLVLSPTPGGLGKLGSDFRQGGRTGPIVVFGSEGFTGASYAALTQEALARLDGLLAALERTRQDERDPEAARLLGELIAQRLGEVDALRAAVDPRKVMDAALWSVALRKLELTLGETIWQARLNALLSGI